MFTYYNKNLALPRELWLVQAGIFLNTFGWGAVLPFEVIYLHGGRGFSLPVAGAIAGTVTTVAVVAAPVAGSQIDRFGARRVAAGAAIALAAGYAVLAFSRSVELSFASAIVAGAGNGALSPAQSTLLTTLAPRELRHRAAAVSRVFTNVGFGVGGAVGGLVASYGLNGFVALFLLNAATYLAYVAVLVAVIRLEPSREPSRAGYRTVLRDRPFRRLAVTNVAVIAVGWGVLPWVVPPYAEGQLGTSARGIGLMMLANAAVVVVAQVPVARLTEGKRRTTMMALGTGLIAASFVLIVGGASYAALVAAAALIGLGECFHTAALVPLVADLAPAELRGRYMAAIGFSWWIGLALAPTLGTQLLAVSPGLTFAAASATAAAAAVSLLALDRHLPEAVQRTPLPAAGGA
jgi:MFS family permease